MSGLEVLARVEAATAAAKVRLVAAYAEAAELLAPPSVHGNGSGAGSSAVGMCVVSEVACVLTIGERAASALLCEAQALTGSLPVVLGALEAGTISWQHARVVVDETTGLTPDAVTAVVTHFFGTDTVNPPGQTTQETLDGLDSLNGLDGLADVPGAGVGGVVVSRFRRKVRGWRERHHPESLEARHVKGVADRRVEFCPDRDGMGWLSLYLPGDTACAVWNKTTALARGLQGPNEDRTLTQLRADVAAGLLLNSPGHHLGTDAGFGAGVRAEVLVTVPVFSLLGLTDEPGEVDGFGPVPASVARRLVADGAQSLYRVLVDPRDGVPLELGRTRYRLSEGLKRWIRLRDGGCTFPGCSNQCLDNENDHLTAWADGGGTGVRNLGQVCPKHHRLKHQSTWTPTGATKDTSPGWTSPSGRYYPAEPPEREPTHLPPDVLTEFVGAQEPNVLPELNSLEPVDPAAEVVRASAHRQVPGTVSWIVHDKSQRRVVLSSLKDLHRPANALPVERLSSDSARQSGSQSQKQASKRADKRAKTRANKRLSP
ncbi:DUF222 domain-containing protein [Arthrobacter ulcerisalmonis]